MVSQELEGYLSVAIASKCIILTSEVSANTLLSARPKNERERNIHRLGATVVFRKSRGASEFAKWPSLNRR